jgi:hypothetical protein
VEQPTADPDETDPFSVEPAEQEPPGEFEIPGKWVEETARVMAYDTPLDPAAGQHIEEIVDGKDDGKKQDTVGAPGFNLRTRFKVLDGSSGEHYGTYYGDEGYSTLDPDSLTRLIGSDLAAGELRIVKLDWSNFDEIEVHVQMEEILHVELEDDIEPPVDETDPLNGYGDGETEARPGGPSSEETPDKEVSSAKIPSGIRYTIYDRRTIQPMGEYVPEGDRSRIDRLTLYKMFPEYDFKTFEIDSIRWETDEVRILIKGEKKKGPGPRVQSPEKKPGQRALLDREE